MLKYLNYDNLNMDRELKKIEKCGEAEIILEPNNKNCLFVLGMLFVNRVNIKILNEKDLNLEDTNKSFTMMPYVWSKIGDKSFPLPDYSNVKTEMDKRIENIKRLGVELSEINDNVEENKIFLICPVRIATDKQKNWIESFVKEKHNEGYKVHAPHLHTRQIDLFGGYAICTQNAKAIASSEEVDIYYDQASKGSVFDLGVAYALRKPLKLLNKNEIEFNNEDLIDRTINSWPYNISNKYFEKIEDLKELLESAWSIETCVPGLRKKWTKENPSLGQCAITSLIVNDFFDGKIMRCMTSSGSHYYNLIGDKIVDLTQEQFLGEIPEYEKGEERSREYLLGSEDTKNRYLLLNKNLQKAINNKKSMNFIQKGISRQLFRIFESCHETFYVENGIIKVKKKRY